MISVSSQKNFQVIVIVQ